MKHISIQQNIKNIYYLLNKESYVKINKNETKFQSKFRNDEFFFLRSVFE